MSATFFHTAIRDDGETEFCAEIAVHSWGCSAQTYGAPENCYPAEGMEAEVIDAWLVSDEHLADAPRITLTASEDERVLTSFAENPPEDDYPEWDQ